MLNSNYHTHTIFSDGKGTPEECIKAALEKGFTSLGFSEHQALYYSNDWTLKEEDIPRYFETIKSLKEKYKSQIDIYTGIELDYIKGHEERFLAPMYKRNQGNNPEILKPDFTIGSVHSLPLSTPGERNGDIVDSLPIDGPEELFQLIIKEEYNSDIERMISAYFSVVNEMLSVGGFDIIGHIDLIKKHNRGDKYFSEKSGNYRKSFLSTLDVVAESKLLLEVNTGGLARGKTDTVYPSPEFLFEAFKRDIPVIVGSDSHETGTLDFYFKETEKMLLDIGYRETAVFKDEKWVMKKLLK